MVHALDGEASTAVNGEIRTAENGSVGGLIPVAIQVVSAVGEHVLGAVGQGEDDLPGLADIEGGIILTVDGYPIKDQMDSFLLGGGNLDPAVGKLTGDNIDPA